MENDNKNEAEISNAEIQGLHNLQRGIGEVCMLMAGHPLYELSGGG